MSVGQFFLGNPGGSQLFEGRRSALYERLHGTVLPYRCVYRERDSNDADWGVFGDINDDETLPTITDGNSNSMAEWVGSFAFGESYNPKHQYDTRAAAGEIWQQRHDPAPTDANYVREYEMLVCSCYSSTGPTNIHNAFQDFMIEFTGPMYGSMLYWEDEYTIDAIGGTPPANLGSPTTAREVFLQSENDTYTFLLYKPTVPGTASKKTVSWWMFWPRRRLSTLASPVPVPTGGATDPTFFIGR